jgi:hypothetical protein
LLVWPFVFDWKDRELSSSVLFVRRSSFLGVSQKLMCLYIQRTNCQFSVHFPLSSLQPAAHTLLDRSLLFRRGEERKRKRTSWNWERKGKNGKDFQKEKKRKKEEVREERPRPSLPLGRVPPAARPSRVYSRVCWFREFAVSPAIPPFPPPPPSSVV